jgi:hypothetical protein
MRLLPLLGDPQEASRWSLQSLPVDFGYGAALAVEGDSWLLKYWQWPDRT